MCNLNIMQLSRHKASGFPGKESTLCNARSAGIAGFDVVEESPGRGVDGSLHGNISCLENSMDERGCYVGLKIHGM